MHQRASTQPNHINYMHFVHLKPHLKQGLHITKAMRKVQITLQ